MCRIAVFPFVIHIGQQGACGITRKLVCKWRAPCAKAATLAIHLVFSFIFDIPKAQRARIQLVLFSVRSAANHRPIELRMITDGDIKTAFACINKRQFEAISQLDEKEREAIETVINSILHMHDAKRWTTKSN